MGGASGAGRSLAFAQGALSTRPSVRAASSRRRSERRRRWTRPSPSSCLGTAGRRRRTSRRRLCPREVPVERGARPELRRERRRHGLDLDRRRDHGSHGAARRESGRGGLQAYDPGYSSFRLARFLTNGALDPTFGSGGLVGTDFPIRGRRIRRRSPSSPTGSSSLPATRTRTTGTTPSSRWRATGQTVPSTRRSATAERGSTTSGATEVPATARCSRRSGHGCGSCKRAAAPPATASMRSGRLVSRQTVRRFHEGIPGRDPTGQSIIPGTTQIDNRRSDCTTEITCRGPSGCTAFPIGLLMSRRTGISSSALRARQAGTGAFRSLRLARRSSRSGTT